MAYDPVRLEFCQQVMAEIEADSAELQRRSYPAHKRIAFLAEQAEVYDNLNQSDPEYQAGCTAKYRIIGGQICMQCEAVDCPLRDQINERFNVPDQRSPDGTLVTNG